MRPQPPAHMIDPAAPPTFRADAEFEEWARATFIEGDGPLVNETHAHLRSAVLGFCWTNVPAKRHGRTILGQCEQIQYGAGLWSKARSIHLLNSWFEGEIDFLLTFYAPAWAEASDRQAFALLEHELAHCGQKMDGYGAPCFSTHDGSPLFAVKSHDVEQFVGVTERYGATSAAERLMAESIMAGPLIDDETIDIVCGSCIRA